MRLVYVVKFGYVETSDNGELESYTETTQYDYGEGNLLLAIQTYDNIDLEDKEYKELTIQVWEDEDWIDEIQELSEFNY